MKTRASVVAALVVAAGLVMSGCAATTPPAVAPTTPTPAPASPATGSDFLADHGLAGLDAAQIIEKLDTQALAERPDDLIASVRPGQLLLSDDQDREASIPLPSDEFYLSFAPYLDHTHECHFHSLTTCTGELGNTDIQVTVADAATGEVLVDDTLRTYDNGFLGLWLPRDIDATLTVRYQDRQAVSELTTRGLEAATCLTTLQLIEV